LPPDLLGDSRGLGHVGHALGDARHDRHARGVHEGAGGGLGAHGVDRIGRRADEGDAGVLACARERRVLGQEPVARVHRLRARGGGHLEDLRDVQVGVRRGARAERVGLVGELHEQRIAVDLGVHGHRADSHLAQRAHHPDRDLATVGDQHRLEHQRLLI
jgi:hypothetical protein